jgi:hypothetical protein
MLAQALDVTDVQAALLDVETTAPISWSSPSGNTYRSMKRPRRNRVRPEFGGRAIPWFSSLPPGRSSRADPVEVHPELRQSHVLEHRDRADRVERSIGHVAVVLVPDLDAVGEPGVGDRLLGPLGLRSRERHADRRTPWRAAACMAIPPPPQPKSSRRIPGESPSFRHTSSYFAAWASSSVTSGRCHTAHE